MCSLTQEITGCGLASFTIFDILHHQIVSIRRLQSGRPDIPVFESNFSIEVNSTYGLDPDHVWIFENHNLTGHADIQSVPGATV